MSLSHQNMSHSDTHQPGLAQLDRYLARCWRSAGIRESRHQDCHQAVYLRLLERFGRDRLDLLLFAAERNGLHAALDGAPVSGPDLFRAIDAVKKRVSRERGLMSLDVAALSPATDRSTKTIAQRSALEEAIDTRLDSRQATVIRSALRGDKPAAIAASLGLAPKTISNEKTLAIRKLRRALLDEGDC
jgi:Bacterial regulatory proteins, luxR family